MRPDEGNRLGMTLLQAEGFLKLLGMTIGVGVIQGADADAVAGMAINDMGRVKVSAVPHLNGC